ncbi:MAG TPA: protein phosphatase 2C domain-containing protein [Kofleriaceae bacterium]|jgi:hypothetical protein
MNTKSLRVASAAVIGARHTRDARNGQDAATAWCDGNRAAIVVCDGCGSGASSEVGARLGARAVLGAITARLAAVTMPTPEEGASRPSSANACSVDAEFWTGVRAEVVAFLGYVARQLPGAMEDVVHDFLLFTIVAAVVVDDTAYVWAIGDGAYAIDGVARELGPFANNQPPYIAYDLIGTPAKAHVETARLCTSVIIATDGVAEMRANDQLAVARISRDPAAFVANPDALRRYLAKQAKSDERIDWATQRVIRTPAHLQDDGAIGLIVREPTDDERSWS